MIAALLLLLSASDSFDALAPQWGPGLRGLPDISIVQVDGDNCLRIAVTSVEPTPGVDDLVRSFPRPVLRSERPFAQAHIYIPPFSEWPTGPNVNGTFNYCGFRLTVTREQGGGLVWPGVFLAGGPTGPHFTVRILSDYPVYGIAHSGWWQLAIGSTVDGRLAFYAVGDRNQTITESDRFFTDPEFFPTVIRSFDGWFLQVATPEPWFLGDVQLYADIQPSLSISRNGGNVTLATDPLFQVERSTDLLSWTPLAGFVDEITEQQQFYRIH